MSHWDSQYGWNELTLPADVSSIPEILDPGPDKYIIIRRIRGNPLQDFSLFQGLSAAGVGDPDNLLEQVPQGMTDKPGLQITLKPGHKLYAFEGASTNIGNNTKVQYAMKTVLVASGANA